MWIKICGNTNLEDAKLAAELGADALGFIFAASKRQVTAAQVAEIACGLPESVERVGVFDSHDAAEIVRVADEAKLHTLQLHGGFDLPLLQELSRMSSRGIRIIQTLHWKIDTGAAGDEQAEQLRAELEQQLAAIAQLGIADRVLIDSKIGTSGGGTGVAFDWAAARSVFASAPLGLSIIAAGGLVPDNVAAAISQLQPWGVDVSSGVEAAPGRKDANRLAAFIANARTAAV